MSAQRKQKQTLGEMLKEVEEKQRKEAMYSVKWNMLEIQKIAIHRAFIKNLEEMRRDKFRIYLKNKEEEK